MLGKRLLVIEDDRDCLQVVSELLTRAGYEAVGVETGREGLRLLHGQTPFDLVLLDFWLPDMTGHALLATRTRWPGALSLPVILITGDDAWVDEHRDLRQLGVVGLLRKPLDGEELVRAVEHALASAAEKTTPSVPVMTKPTDGDTAVAAGAARQARRLSDLLTRASDLLAQSLDVPSQLRDIARLLVPAYADACVIEQSDASGLSRELLCVQHESSNQERELRALAERPEGLGRLTAQVLETGQAQLIESGSSTALRELGYTEGDAERLVSLGFESVLVVPLIARRRVFGALTCASRGARRRYTRSHLETLSDLGHRIALALDNAELMAVAQQATRAREELLTALSRDLRTPLSTILSTATRLLQNSDSAAGTEAGATIVRSARKLEMQIRDLLDLAQLEAGNLRIELRKERLGELLRQVCEAQRPAVAARPIALELDADARDAELACDPERIKQVLHTLLDHAQQVSGPDGEVGVRLSYVDGDLHVTVSDTGPSLSEDEVAALNEGGRPAHGRGHESLLAASFPLRIARGLIEAHGGQLWVQSQPGSGNAFHFTLQPSVSIAELSAPAGGPVIFLVDSDLAFRRELQEILCERGYRVETADNGWQAWSYLQAHPAPALILLDLMLPVMDGWELHAAIKSHPQLCAVPTVVVSGLDRYRIEASLSDAQGYIEKPIRTAQLFDVVSRYVASPTRARAPSVRPESRL